MCGSRPGLDTTTIDVCAVCFARDQQKKQADRRKSLGKSRKVKKDFYENKLLRMRPELIDLPLEPVPLWYLMHSFYGGNKRKWNTKNKISKVQREFLIEKFSGILIIHKRNGRTYCCKNRAKYLNLQRIRKIFVWRGLIPGVQPDRPNISDTEDTEVKGNSNPNKRKEKDNRPQDYDQRDTDTEGAGSVTVDYEPEEFDEPLTKPEKKKRKQNVSLPNPNQGKGESGESSSGRKKRKNRLETIEAVDTSVFEDIEILEVEEPHSHSTPSDAGMCETLEHGERNRDRDVKFVTSTKIKRDPEEEESSHLSVPSTKHNKRQKKNRDEKKAIPTIANKISDSNRGPEDEQSRPELIQRSSIAFNDANGKPFTNGTSGPKRRSLWSVLLEESDDEELRSTGDTGIPEIRNNKGIPPNGNSEFEVQEPQDEAPSPSAYQVQKLRVSNDAVGNSAMSHCPTSDSSSDSDVESILTPSKRKAYLTSAVLDDSDKEKLRSKKRSKPSSTSTRSTNKPGPASRKLVGPASKKLPIAVDVGIQQNSSSPSPPSYRRVKKAARRKREAPLSYAETSDSDSDFIITSSSENDSDFSYDSDATSVTCTSDTSNDSRSSSVVCIDDRDNVDEGDDEIEIQNVSDDDEEVRERVSASRDPRFQPVVILEHNSEVEAKLATRKITRQDWMNLEREREDYEEKFLGSLQFSKRSLDYAIDVVTKALNWEVFPFGAKVLNRGRITQRQKRNPNGEEWLQIKQEFIIRHFKTALSITHWRRQWYCCQNRADTLDIKEYLERFWKIEL